jgi:hypothetical protein
LQYQEFADFYAESFVKLCLGEDVPKLRPIFGDKIDLAWIRTLANGFLAYSEEARLRVYDVGKTAGRFLAIRLKERGILSDFLHGRVANSIGICSTEQLQLN